MGFEGRDFTIPYDIFVHLPNSMQSLKGGIFIFLIPSLVFPIESTLATSFDWEWEPSSLQRWGKAQVLRIYSYQYICISPATWYIIIYHVVICVITILWWYIIELHINRFEIYQVIIYHHSFGHLPFCLGKSRTEPVRCDLQWATSAFRPWTRWPPWRFRLPRAPLIGAQIGMDS